MLSSWLQEDRDEYDVMNRWICEVTLYKVEEGAEQVEDIEQ